MSIEAMKQALETLRQAIEEAEKREWVGLTVDEFVDILNETGERSKQMSELEITVALWKAIEKKLKEKNT